MTQGCGFTGRLTLDKHRPHTPRTEAGLAALRARRSKRVAALLIVCGAAGVIAAGWWLAATWPSTPVSVPVERQAASLPTEAVEATASAIPTLPPEPSGPTTITVAAVGDMHFDRQVQALIAKAGGSAPLADVAARLASADIAVGNLESVLSNRGTRRTDKEYTFQGDPRGVEGLALAGFDFLSLANNHMMDCGTDAFTDTLASLDTNGIGRAGAGMNKAEAWTPAVRSVGSSTVAFLSFSHVLPSGFIATSNKPGIAQGRLNMNEVEAAIRAADAAYDYVLVSYHWGVENVDDCNAEQVRDAHRSIDAGADMVLSHHPHVIQAVERYNGKLIAYSLGDFVFDHYSRKTGEAFILEAELGPGGVGQVGIVPVYLDKYGKPEYVSGQEAFVILERLAAISAKRGTTVEILGDTAVVRP